MTDDSAIPSRVQDLATMAEHNVTRVVGVAPDYTPETLPLVDQYLREVPPDAAPEVRDLVVVTVGCYFGEVVRRLLNGRWALPGEAPEGWRIELQSCFLHFTPVGMAGEVLTGDTTEDHDGGFGTLPRHQEALAEALAEAGPVPEDEYYSLSGRVDVLQLVADLLVGRALASREPVRSCTPEDYSEILDSPDA